jgi:hypothetical protein
MSFLFTAVQNNRISSQRGTLIAALEPLAARLTIDQAKLVTMPLLKAIEAGNDPYELRGLARAIGGLPVELLDTQLKVVLDHLVKVIESTTETESDPVAFLTWTHLMDAVGALPIWLTREQALLAIETILKALKETSTKGELKHLSEAMRAVMLRLRPEEASTFRVRLLAEFQAEALDATGGWRLGTLADAILALPDHVSPEDIKLMLASLLHAIGPDQLNMLIRLFPLLSSEQRATATEEVLKLVRVTDSPLKIHAYITALRAFGVKLTAAQDSIALNSLLRLIRSTTQTNELALVAQSLRLLGSRPTPTEMEGILDRFLGILLSW